MTFGAIVFKKTTRVVNRKFTPLWLLVSGAALEACGGGGSTTDLSPSIIETDLVLKTYSFDEGETIDSTVTIFNVIAIDPEDPTGMNIKFKIQSQTIVDLFAIDSGTGVITFNALFEDETLDYENPKGLGVDFSSLSSTDARDNANTYNINVVATANGLDSKVVTYTVTITDLQEAAALADKPNVEPVLNIVAPPTGVEDSLDIPVAEFLAAFFDPDTNPDNQITRLSFNFPLPTGVTLQYDGVDISDGVPINIRDGGDKIIATIADGTSVGEIKLSYSGAEGPEGQDVIFGVASLTFYINNAPTIVSVGTDVPDATIVDDNAIVIDENTGDDVAIFRITVNDIDDPDGHDLEYTLEGIDANLFNVESVNANVAIISFRSGDDVFSPDFEAPEDIAVDNILGGNNVYEVTIVATDGLKSEVRQDLTITITDQNEAPTGIALSPDTIAENQVLVAVDTNEDGTNDANYYLIGDIIVTDPDAPEAFNNNPLVVKDFSTGTDSSDFMINAGKLYLTTALDFETTDSYKIIIVANEGVTGLEFISDTITITVDDVNEAPVLVGGPFELDKVKKGSDAGAGKSVSISHLLASNRYSDEDADDTILTITKLEITGISAVGSDGVPITLAPSELTLTYTAEGSTADPVSIGIDSPINKPSEGVSILGNIDISIADTVADGTLFVITYKIYDSGTPSLASNEDTIEFSAVTSLPVQFDNVSATVSVDENSATDTFVATVTATPEDSNLSIVYSLEDDLFEINPTDGVITLKIAGLDFEDALQHYLTITATATASGSDPATDDPFGTFILTVNVGDINEAPIGIEILDENGDPTTSIIENELSVPVDTTDDGTPNANYYLVGTVSYTDPDAPGAFTINTVSIDTASEVDFYLDSATKELYLRSKPDYELPPISPYSVTIIVQDASGDTNLVALRTIVIDVVNADDLADVTVLDSNNAEVTDFNTAISITENVDAGTALYTFTGTDQDADDQGVHETVRFRLAVEGSIFQIVTNADGTASLTFASSPDFEAEGAPTYNVKVIAYSVVGVGTVDEAVVDQIEVSRIVKIVVIDVDDAPTDIEIQDENGDPTTSIIENEPIVPVDTNDDGTDDANYYLVGTVAVMDEDTSDAFSNNPLVVKDYSDNAISSDFKIVNGKLYLTTAPNFEASINTYSIIIVANEGVTGLEFISDQIDISVENVAELAVVTVLDSSNNVVTDFDTAPLLQIAENVDASSTVLYTFSGTDDDADETVKFKLSTTDVTKDIFEIGTGTGGLSYLTFVSSPDFENPRDADADAPENNIYSVDVIAYSVDASGTRIVDSDVSTIVKIQVTNVNERPSIILPDSLSSIAGSFLIGDPDNTVILTVSATDPDADDILTYSINAVRQDRVDGAVFEISSTTGELSFASTNAPTVANEYVVTISVTDIDGSFDTIEVYVSAVKEIAKHQVTFAPQGTDLISFSDLVSFAPAVTDATAEFITFTDWDMTRVTLSYSSGQIIQSGTPVAIQEGDVLQIANTFSSYKKDSLIRYFVNYDNFSSRAVILGIDIDGTQPEITVDNSGFGDLVQYVTTPPTDDVTLASYSATDDDLDPAITYKLYYQIDSGDYVEILSTDTLFGFAMGDSSDVVLKSGANLILTDPNLIENSQGSYLKIVVAAFDSVTVDYEISEISDSSKTSFDVYLERFDPYFGDTEISLNENDVLSQPYTATPIAAPGAVITYSIKTGLSDDGALFDIVSDGTASDGTLTFLNGTFTPDFETKSQYTLTVIASYDELDGTTLTREQELTINIIDVNEVPEFVSTTTVVPIDGNVTPIPGTISIDDLIALFVDKDTVEEIGLISGTITRINFYNLGDIGLEYKGDLIVASTNDKSFVIDYGITEIKIRNFGVPAGGTHTISYTVEDGVEGESATAQLELTNIAGSELEISLGDDILPTVGDQLGDFYYQISISEHYANGNPPVFTSVYRFGDAVDILATVLATDDDGVTAITYSILLQFDTFTNWDVDIFVIDSISGKLTIKDDVFLSNDPDSQVGKEYSVIIIATSGDDSEPLELLVSIEYLPEFVADVESVVIALSAFDDETTTLFELASTTRNASVDSTYTMYEYSIESQKDGSGTELVVALFEMEATNYIGGKVTLIAGKSLAYTASLDYDANGENTYTITVVASGWDTSVGAGDSSGTDELPRILGDTLELTLTVREDLEINADVTNLHYEKELGDAKVGHTYSLTGTGSDLFSVATKSGKTLLIYNIDNIDNTPATGTYQLTLLERVGVDGILVETLLFTASIVSVGASANYADGDILSITEGTSAVGDITIQTPDGTDIDETAGLVEYYFIGGGDGDRKFFDINPATGEITFKTAPDYEAPFKTIVLEVGETSADALVKANTYNITVGATTSGDSPFYGSVVKRDLVVKVTDVLDDEIFILQDRKTSHDVAVSYKPNDNIESEIQVIGIAGAHQDSGQNVLAYRFIPAGTIVVPILSAGFTIKGVLDITDDDEANHYIVDSANHPFEILSDGNLVIANLDPALNYGDAADVEGGVQIDEIRQEYQVIVTDGTTDYAFDIKLSPFNLAEFWGSDTITYISIFENMGTPAVPHYKVTNITNLYSYSVDTTLTPDTPPGLLYLGDAIQADGLDELFMLASVDLTTYDPPTGGSDFFDFDMTFTLYSKDADPTASDTIFETVTKSLRIEIKDAPILGPQDLTNLDLGLGEGSTTPLDLEAVFPLALLDIVGYEDYIVTYAIAPVNTQNLQDIFTITAGTDLVEDQLSIDPSFDYETTLIPLIHRGELIGYSDGYLKHINTVNITLDLAGTLVGSTGAETAKTNLRIHLGDDTEEIVFVSSSSATVYADTGNDDIFYVAYAVKESDNILEFGYTLSSGSDKFAINFSYGEVTAKVDVTIVNGDTFTVIATGGGSTQEFEVTVSVDPDDQPADLVVPEFFIHKGYTDIYAVENEATNSMLYKIYHYPPYDYHQSYTLAGADAQFFDISEKGELTFKSGLDFENPADIDAVPDNIYAVTINASIDSDDDNDGTFDYSEASIDLNIHIVDVDEAPVLDKADFFFVIGSDDYSSPLGVFTAIDPDATGDVITYSITGDDALLLFDISATGELTFKTQPVVDELIFKAQPVAGELAGQVIASSTGSSGIEQSDIIDFTVKVILSTGSDAGGTSSFEASDIDGDIIELIPVDYWAS